MNYIFTEAKWEEHTKIHFMSFDGSVYGQLYFYHDEPEKFMLAELMVSPAKRNKGLGTKMQQIREKKAKEMGAKTLHLWVEKDSWLIDWYKRRGYVLDGDMDDKNYWMKKEV